MQNPEFHHCYGSFEFHFPLTSANLIVYPNSQPNKFTVKALSTLPCPKSLAGHIQDKMIRSVLKKDLEKNTVRVLPMGAALKLKLSLLNQINASPTWWSSWELAYVSVIPLLIVFAMLWWCGEVPEHWKKANVTPVSKEGKEGPGNKQPVSLISSPGKVTGQIILETIWW